MNKILGVIQTTRLFTSLVISLIIILPNLKNFSLDSNYVLLAFNLLLTALGGFTLNDYFDANKDVINKPHRPIPSKKLSKKEALYIAFVLLTGSFAMSVYNILINNFGFIQLIILMAIMYYNFITKYFGLTKTIYTALLTSIVVVFPIITNGYELKYMLLPLGTFFFIMGREIFMDILDMKGDKTSGMETIPIKFGVKNSTKIACLFLFCGSILLVPLFLNSDTTIQIFRFAVIALSLFIFFVTWTKGSIKVKRSAIICLWIPMLVGLSLFLN